MGSGRRKYKIRGKLGEPQREDRISSLPDEILGHILSFLPTNYTVATSALSSRWRNLYKLTTSLDFDDSVSFNPGKGFVQLRRKTSFGKFVDTILARCKESHIGNFKLKCGKNFDHSLIRDWLKATSFCEIFELELSIHSIVPHSQLLQVSLLNCQNLVVLKLDSNFLVDVNFPRSVTLPCLRMLVLKEIKFIDGSCVSLILSRCPLLEELQIEGCAWNGGNLYIDNPLLKRLSLDVGVNRPFDEFIVNFVYLNAPSLIYLKYCESLAQQYDFRNLKALVEAHISVCFYDDEFYEPQDLCDAILDLIIGVSNCELLYLSGQCLEALTSGEFQLPVFHNLTRLELGVGCDVSWEDVLPDFLISSPCLRALTFMEGLVKWNTEGESDFLSYEHAVPLCVESCLKVIDMKDFRGVKEELDIAAYFLENANVLDKLVLRWCQPNKTKEILQKEEEILKLPKASETCLIVFR